MPGIPEGPSTQYLRTLVPKAIKGRVFGTRVLKYWVLGPSGYAAEIIFRALKGMIPVPMLEVSLAAGPKSGCAAALRQRPAAALDPKRQERLEDPNFGCARS